MRRFTSIVFVFLALVACAALGGSVQERKSFWAFTGPWDARSDASLRANAASLDVAVTGWVALDSLTGEPLLPSPYPDTMRLASGTTQRFALVTSWHGQGFHAASIRALGGDRGRLATVAGRIARHADSLRYAGLVLDFETLKASDVPVQLTVVRAIADSARVHGVTTIAVAIPAEPDDAYPTHELVKAVDYVLVMLYDQHWAGSQPGPISSPDWVERNLSRVVGEVGASRVVAGLPLYGYHWVKGKPGIGIAFDAGLRAAERERFTMTRDSASRTLRGASRSGSSAIWLTDASLVADLLRSAEELGVTRFAFWRLGQEDPHVWSRLAR